MFSRKGQGSLEYLLLIGGAVLVAAIVIALVVTSTGSTGTATDLKTAASQCFGRNIVVATTSAPQITLNTVVYSCCSTAATGNYTGAITPALAAGINGASLATCATFN
ncbi:MAG: class III signal peptide-containing protein [Candidatus Diapherotrites archaeon]|nr:class III signal peptide-containing protein [Candidatus Diapherotrites archaeon]